MQPSFSPLKPRKSEDLKPLLAQLRSVFDSEIKGAPGDAPLSIAALGDLLPQVLGEVAQIVHPAIAGEYGPLHNDPQRAASGAIRYAQLIHSHCLTASPRGAVLPKPLIIPLFEAVEEVIAWKLLVVLPPGYQPLYGEVSRKMVPSLYWFDPMAKQTVDFLPRSCVALYRILREGCQQIVQVQGQPFKLQIQQAFPKACFYNGSENQALVPADSGYWLVYAACLTVLTGAPPPRLVGPLKDRKPAERLRQIYATFQSSQPIAEKKEKKPSGLPIAKTEEKVAPEALMQAEKSLVLPTVSVEGLAKTPAAPSSVPLLPSVSLAAAVPTPPLPPLTVEAKTTWADAKAPFPDAALELKAYTSQQIHALLQAQGIPAEPAKILSFDTHGQYVFYAYPPQALYPELFIEDQARYFLTQAGEINPRRVAWLLPLQGRLPIALLVQLGKPAQAAAKALYATCTEQKLSRPESLVADAKSAGGLRRLYSQVSIQILGADAALTQTLLQQLSEPLQRAYQPAEGRLAITCKAHVDNYPTLILVADIVEQLKTGQTVPVPDIHALQQAHIRAVRAACIQQLSSWQAGQPTVTRGVLGSLRRLLKYQVLTHYRQTRYPVRENTWAGLLAYQAHDHAIKTAIYSQPLEALSSLVESFGLTASLGFLSFARDPGALADLLQQQADQEQAKLEVWQRQLQEQIYTAKRQTGCWDCFKHRASQAAYLGYQHSYLGLGDQLLNPFGHLAQQSFPESFMEQSRQVLQESAKWTVLLTTASSVRAERAKHYVAQHVNRDRISQVFRVLGSILGGMVTYCAGGYSSFRFMTMGILGHKVGEWLSKPVLKDGLATVDLPSAYQPGPVGVARLTSLGFTAVEAYTEGSYVPLLMALGGMGGSSAGRALARKAIPPLEAKPDTLEAAQLQANILFLLSLVGYEVGQWLTGQAMQTARFIFDKQHVRTAAITQLEAMEARGDIRYLRVEFPDWRFSPRFWLTAENPLHITAVDVLGQLYESDCQVHGSPTQVQLTCETTLPSVPRLMGQS